MPDYTNAATVAAISAILKENWVTNTIQMQYARNRVLTALLEKSTKDVDGLESVFTMRLAPNTSTGARGEMGDLPRAGRQTTKKVRMPLAYWYTVCAFSGPAIQASKNSATALAKVVTDELENGVEDHKRVENAFMFGDGSGALTQVAAVNAGTKTITVDRWHSLLSEGRYIQTAVEKAGTTAGMAANQIVSVNRAEKTVTFASVITGAAENDFMFLEGTVGNANMGLLGICDDGEFVSTFQTLDRSLISQAKAKVFRGTGGASRNISEDLLMDVIARMREDGASPDLLVGTSFQLNDLCKEAKETRRFIDPKGYDLGISGIKIGDGVDFTFDVDCPAGHCFGLTKSKIQISELGKLGFMDKDGNVMCRISGKDAYEATLFHYYNLIAMSCYDQARIDDLNENRAGD
jgi:hypothetical protein